MYFVVGQHVCTFLFLFFSSNTFTDKTVNFDRIRTRIVGVKGAHLYHKTTTTFIIITAKRLKLFLKVPAANAT